MPVDDLPDLEAEFPTSQARSHNLNVLAGSTKNFENTQAAEVNFPF
jgi:hypothetical protein